MLDVYRCRALALRVLELAGAAPSVRQQHAGGGDGLLLPLLYNHGDTIPASPLSPMPAHALNLHHLHVFSARLGSQPRP